MVDMSVGGKGMDSDGHTRDKLELYRQYLARYLPIMANQRFYEKIDIYDIFAGRGKYENNQDGSALIAAKLIDQALKSSNKDISLFLNEYDRENCEELRKHLEGYNFSKIANLSANDFITELSRQAPEGTIEFFFIDPYGYTQVSKESYEALFQRRKSEYLIFVPISHIHRFINEDEINPAIKKFIDDMGIDIEKLKGVDIDDFGKIICESLKRTSEKAFCLYKDLKNRKSSNQYGLYFISDHVFGAEKFLESIKKLDDMTNPQTTFEFIKERDIREKIGEIIGNSERNNTYLYYTGIQQGILPSDMIAELRKLEDEGKIIVEGEERKKRGFYISYEHYKNKNNKIRIKLAPQ